jgi:hypothetical protein
MRIAFALLLALAVTAQGAYRNIVTQGSVETLSMHGVANPTLDMLLPQGWRIQVDPPAPAAGYERLSGIVWIQDPAEPTHAVAQYTDTLIADRLAQEAIAASNAAYQASIPVVMATGIEIPMFVMQQGDKGIGYVASMNGDLVKILYAHESPYDLVELETNKLNALAADNDRVQNNKAIRAAIEGLTDAITNAVAQFKDVDDAHNALVASYTNMAANIDLMVADINARPAPAAYITTNTVAILRNIQSTNNATFNAVRDAGQKTKQYGQDVRAYSVQAKQAQKAALQSLRDIAAQLKALMRNEIDR